MSAQCACQMNRTTRGATMSPASTMGSWPLIPVRVTLRDFVARSCQGRDGRIDREAMTACGGLSSARSLSPCVPSARRSSRRWLQTGGLLLLDGLDEVPEADRRRAQVKAAVEQFAAVFPKVRALVTSRTYAYQHQDWKLKGFSEADLAAFDRAGQIHQLVERWYAYVGQGRGSRRTTHRGARCCSTRPSGGTPASTSATRPLLLTLMAALHAWRGGRLPEQREDLYAEAVDFCSISGRARSSGGRRRRLRGDRAEPDGVVARGPENDAGML